MRAQTQLQLNRRYWLLVFLLIFFLWIPAQSAFCQSLEYKAYKATHIDRNRKFDSFFNVISISAYPIGIVSPGIVYLATLPKEERLWNGIATVGSLGLAMGVTTVLKLSIARRRPYYQYSGADPYKNESTYSMPSGHTTAAFTMAVNNAIYLKKWYFVVPSYAFAVGVGYSRMHLGEHFLTDVAAGALIGTASGILSAFLFRQINHNGLRQP